MRITPPEGKPPRIAVLPAAGLAAEGIDYDVSLVTPDAALGDFSPDSDYRNPAPTIYLGPPVRLRVADLQHATYYTAPLDLGEGATITVPLTEPGEVLGLLTGRGGKPVPGARVRLRAPFGFRHWEWDEPDEAGEFYLGCDLPIGPQAVEIRLPGHIPVFRRIDIGPGRLTEVEIRLD